jgi:L-alanine-DL-glutamate epimerase-like enolase superfamily enzyme
VSRIAHLEAFTVALAFTEEEESATVRRRGFTSILLRLETDDGVVGWGETSGASGAPPESVRAVVEALAPLALGESVFESERLRLRLIEMSRMANLRRLAHLACAAYDIACWDCAGQTLGRPIHELIGGAVRRKVDFYAYPLSKSPEQIAAEAREAVGEGFTVVYVKVGLGEERDEAVVAAVREAIGEGARLRIDANEGWDLATAKRMCVRLEKYGIDFVEQPLDARDLAGARALRTITAVPIAANQGIWSLADAAQTITAEACDVIVTGPLWAGGLLPLQRIGALCADAGIGFCRHSPPETSIATAAGLQVLATLPRLLPGNQHYLSHLADDVATGLGTFRDGCLDVPTAPGLGIVIDEDRVREFAKRYRREGDFAQVIPSKDRQEA